MIGGMRGPGYPALAGVAVGSWLGTSIGGIMLGGGGNWIGSLAGTLGGSAVSLLLRGVSASPSPLESGLLMAMMVALPVCGGAIGYEVGEALSVKPPMKRLAPAISITRDGQGAIAGLAGTF